MQISHGSNFDGSINMKVDTGSKNKQQFKLKIPAFELVGFAFYLGWIFSLFWSPSIFPIAVFSDFEIHIARISMTIGMLVSYVFYGVLAKFLATKRGEAFLRILVIMLCPAACIGGIIGTSDVTLTIVFWVLSGIGTASLLLVWSRKLVTLTRKQLIFSIAGAFFISAFLFLSTSFIENGISFYAIASLPLLSLIISIFVSSSSVSFSQSMDDESAKRKIEEDTFENEIQGEELESKAVPSPDTKGQRLSFMRMTLLALAYSVGIGFVGACITTPDYYPDGVYIIAGANCCAALFAVYYLVRKVKNISIVLTEILLPIMLICIFFFSFVGYIGQLICLFLLFALLACYDVIDMASVSKSTELFNENYIRTFAFGRTLNGVGCTLGWITGTILSFAPTQETSMRLFICFALVVFLVSVTSFAIFHPEPISYFKKKRIEDEDTIMQISIADLNDDHFGLRVSAVAQKYELTSRQKEVLCYLAQGRNASYIAQKCTISNHTAKSHIYNIYTKLDVHSQQDLLDIIDSVGDEVKLLANE